MLGEPEKRRQAGVQLLQFATIAVDDGAVSEPVHTDKGPRYCPAAVRFNASEHSRRRRIGNIGGRAKQLRAIQPVPRLPERLMRVESVAATVVVSKAR